MPPTDRFAPVVRTEDPFNVSAPPMEVKVEGVEAEMLPSRFRFPATVVPLPMFTVPEPESVRE